MDPFDDTYLKEQMAIIKPKEKPVIQESIQKQGKPALVFMNLAHEVIAKEEMENPQLPKMTELQKGKVALNFLRMNASPQKFKHYKRFMNNKGDINIPGYDPFTGKRGNRLYDSSQLSRKPHSSQLSGAKDKSKLDTQQTFPDITESKLNSRLRQNAGSP